MGLQAEAVSAIQVNSGAIVKTVETTVTLEHWEKKRGGERIPFKPCERLALQWLSEYKRNQTYENFYELLLKFSVITVTGTQHHFQNIMLRYV
ncbi:hypothetical protein PR048_005040 [Dryococelus australis]|uniref:Uncharacterized protein n=1 Tax=Dryococelus australis TaxID=614101 RepID=A0ABQ9I748_9NEOP|nr:hypothetical protein PR048_005040 [Dryococelus australis]